MKHLPQIQAITVEHKCQRYNTVGDYYAISTGRWIAIISRLGDWRMEFALLIHELCEMAFTTHHGIPWKDIDRFDMDNPDLDDPGACPKAPYHQDHMAAEKIEKQVLALLGVSWEEYMAAQDKVWQSRSLEVVQ